MIESIGAMVSGMTWSDTLQNIFIMLLIREVVTLRGLIKGKKDVKPNV